MALATLTITANNEAIDFHRNDSDIKGVESGDEYIYIKHINRLSILDDGIIIKMDNNSEIYLRYNQVEQIGATTVLPHFTDVPTMKAALKTLLGL